MQSETRRLRDLCSLIVDCPHSTPVWTESGYIVIRNQNIKGGRLDLSTPSFTDAEHFAHRIRRAKPTAGDIVFTREAPMGEVCMVPPHLECCVGQRQVLLRPNPKVVDGRFLLYALQSPKVQHEISWSEGTGSTVSNVRIPVLEALRIPTPDLTIQQEIGILLGMLDDRIDLLRQTNATLESIAQAMFKSWFIDFDPVRAKAEGREPEGIGAATAALFPAEFEDSALGLIPKGWAVRRIEELAVKVAMGPFGSNIKVSTFVDSGIPVISGQHLRGALLEDSAFNFITEEHAQRLSGSLVRPGDIVLTHAGNIGQVALIPSDAAYQTYVLSQRQFFLRCNSDLASPEHLMYFLRSSVGRHLLLANASQVGVPSIARPATYLKSIQLVVPPVEVARAFADHANAAHLTVGSGRRRIALLEELRDVLLPRLISGKVRLSEGQAQLEEALP